MAAYVITCCSTVDMPRAFMEKNHVPCASFHYQMDGKEYIDDMYTTISSETFYQRIADGAEPVTSQINAEEYRELFEPILQQGKDILHITLSSGISGTYGSANIAKQMLEEEYPERKLIVVDSLAASSGYGLLLTAALDNQKNGMSLEENEQWLLDNRLYVHHWFFSTDLTSFIRGGRISKASGWFGTVLNICPLMNVDANGKLIPRTKHRGKKMVMKELVSRMKEFARNGSEYNEKCYISHANCQEDARTVAAMLEKEFPRLKKKIEIFDIGTVIGSHTGPGTVALFFWSDRKRD